MLACWRQGQLNGVAQTTKLPGTAEGFGKQNPQIFRRCAFGPQGWFPECILPRDQPTSRRRCHPRGIRLCMKPNHNGRRICMLCSVRGSRIGADGNSPSSAAARRASSSDDPLRPHPDPWSELCEARTAFPHPRQLQASVPKRTPLQKRCNSTATRKALEWLKSSFLELPERGADSSFLEPFVNFQPRSPLAL